MGKTNTCFAVCVSRRGGCGGAVRLSQGRTVWGLVSVTHALHEVRLCEVCRAEVWGALSAPALSCVTHALPLPGSGNS